MSLELESNKLSGVTNGSMGIGLALISTLGSGPTALALRVHARLLSDTQEIYLQSKLQLQRHFRDTVTYSVVKAGFILLHGMEFISRVKSRTNLKSIRGKAPPRQFITRLICIRNHRCGLLCDTARVGIHFRYCRVVYVHGG
jgi:hypothetical protein